METLKEKTIKEVITIVEADAAKASNTEKVYKMNRKDKARQGDVYLMCFDPLVLFISEEDMNTNLQNAERKTELEIAKNHVLKGDFLTVNGFRFAGWSLEAGNGAILVIQKEPSELLLTHPEHAHHRFSIPAKSGLLLWQQRTMDKNSVGDYVRD